MLSALQRFTLNLCDIYNSMQTSEITQATIAYIRMPRIIFMWAEGSCEGHKWVQTSIEVQLTPIMAALLNMPNSLCTTRKNAVQMTCIFCTTRWSDPCYRYCKKVQQWVCNDKTIITIMITWIIDLLMDTVSDSGVDHTDHPIRDDHCQLSPFVPDWMAKADCDVSRGIYLCEQHLIWSDILPRS